MLSSEEQALLRLRLFAELELLVQRQAFFTLSELQRFTFEGKPFPLASYRGIFNPVALDETLSIVSSRTGPYEDHVGADGLFRYAFQSGDPRAGANRKLRRAITQSTPLILFERPEANLYVPVFPVYAVDEDLAAGFVTIAAGQDVRVAYHSATDTLDKQYIERVVKQRVHQPVFRARVLSAYNKRCAICTLKYAELLDAAHILPDSDERGLPVVTNGMAMCTIHHRAYDQNFLGVSPDYTVHINERLLADRDGPMLQYGLQAMDGKALELPSRRDELPDREYLAERYAAFEG